MQIDRRRTVRGDSQKIFLTTLGKKTRSGHKISLDIVDGHRSYQIELMLLADI